MGDFDKRDFEPLGIILRIPSRKRRPKPFGGSGGSSGGGRSQQASRVSRLVRGTPEVMLKITGRTKGLQHLRQHLDYITRNGEVAANGPEQSVIWGRDSVRELADTWWSQRAVVPGSRRRDSVESVNFMLSMPDGTDRDKFYTAATTFADRAFGGRFDYVVADHRDTDHTHVHLTVRARGVNGARLNPRKDDLSMWREWMAHELRAVGIDAEATPRRARGVIQKGKNQAIKHLDQRGASRVQRAKVAAAVQQVTAGDVPLEMPWETAIKERQRLVRQAWGDLAKRLASTNDQEDQRLAEDIRKFVARMPAVKTERETLREVVVAALKAREQQRDGHER